MIGSEDCETMRESGFNSRFEIRLNGFSSTLRRRDLWSASVKAESLTLTWEDRAGVDSTFFWLA